MSILTQSPYSTTTGTQSTIDSSSKKTRYALCGLSMRGIYHFMLPLLGKVEHSYNNFSEHGEVVGILDIDEQRVKEFNQKYDTNIPWFSTEKGVDEMIRQTQPDTLLVAGPDFTHCEHILAGLKHDLRVIVEKPMVPNCEEVRKVLDAERKSKGSLVVTHNYRYSTLNRKIKKLLMAGKVGKIVNIEFTYNLDTLHGSSFFYRWNRQRANSGGLTIHKAVHHFDLMNWFTDSHPETVFSFGSLNFYGANGFHRPKDKNGQPLDPIATRANCPYFTNHHASRGASLSGRLKPTWDRLGISSDAQYPKVNYIYDDEIDIEDTYASVIRYANGAFLSYSTNYSSPWEGFVLGINGTEGRLEVSHHTDPSTSRPGFPGNPPEKDVIRVMPMFGGLEEYTIAPEEGGHGGGDPMIRRDLFVEMGKETLDLGLSSDSYDAALGIAVGEAVWRSSKEGRPYQIQELLGEFYQG